MGPATLIHRCAELPEPALTADQVDHTVVVALRTLATRILALKAETYHLHTHLRALVAAQALQPLIGMSGRRPRGRATCPTQHPAVLRRSCMTTRAHHRWLVSGRPGRVAVDAVCAAYADIIDPPARAVPAVFHRPNDVTGQPVGTR